MAGLHCISYNHLAIRVHCYVHEPYTAYHHQDWPVLHSGWSLHHHSGLRNNAEQDWQGLRKQFFRMERLAKPNWLEQQRLRIRSRYAEWCICRWNTVCTHLTRPHASLHMLNPVQSDCVSHLAEEIPRPRVNIPKAILAQYVVGFITAFCYVVTIFYSVNDLDSLFSNPWPFPLAELYRQSTNSVAGSLGLLIVIFLPTFCTNIGCYITTGRMLWTLGRDGATPWSSWIGRVNHQRESPLNATLTCAVLNTILGLVYIGSSTAFSAFVGSFIVLASLSYLAFILPNIFSRRRHVIKGPFTMPSPVFYTVASIASGYMCVWIVIYCFPFAVPFTATTMNYTSVMTGGCTILLGAWYLWIRNKGYVGPRALIEDAERLARGDDVIVERASSEKI
jgi:hypothetical protein